MGQESENSMCFELNVFHKAEIKVSARTAISSLHWG